MVKKDCWQSISAPGEDVGTLDLVAEPFGRVENGFLSRMCGWLPEWFLPGSRCLLSPDFVLACARPCVWERARSQIVDFSSRDSYYVLSIYPCYAQGSRFSLLFKIVVYVLSIYGFHQNGFICMFFLAVSVLSIFFMFISLDSWYFFQPGWFTLC